MEKINELMLSALILPTLKDIIVPKIKEALKSFSKEDEISEREVEISFENYLIQKYEKFQIMDTLVFANRQTQLKILYEPLTVYTELESDSKLEIKIDGFPKDFLPKFVRIIIEDTAGMGKSTISKKLFLSIIEDKEGIPMLIELRHINKENTFIEEIQSQLSGIGKPFDLKLLNNLISSGEFIFIFDGFDEISKVDRDFVLKDLHKFIEKANDNYFLITSRAEASLASFGGFQKFRIRPLTEDEAHSIIRNYDTYSNTPIAIELISQLQRNEQRSLKEFMSNPFLVSLLYKSFEYKKNIPLKKTQFYNQVYDALFEAHDFSKQGYLKRDKHSNLHLDDFERVLRHVAYLTSIQNKVEYEKDYIINIIEKAKHYMPDLSYKSNDFLKDLIETVPIFKKDGNSYKWAHKSLQDYFAAKFIWNDSGNSQIAILEKIFQNDNLLRFYNVLDLLHELTPKLVENSIIYWTLNEFYNHNEKILSILSTTVNDLIKERISLIYKKKLFLIIVDKKQFISTEIQSKVNNSKLTTYLREKRKEMKLTNFSSYYFYSPTKIAIVFEESKLVDAELHKFLSDKIPTICINELHNSKLADSDLPKIDLDKIYEINLNPNNIINSNKNYSKVNNLLQINWKIIYEPALEKLDMITANLGGKMETDLINWQ